MGFRITRCRPVNAHPCVLAKPPHASDYLRLTEFCQIRLCEWCWALLYSTRLPLARSASDWFVSGAILYREITTKSAIYLYHVASNSI